MRDVFNQELESVQLSSSVQDVIAKSNNGIK